MDHFWAAEKGGKFESETGYFDLGFLRYLVIDEADRLMTDCRFDWLSHVELAVFGMDYTNPKCKG